ncbi:MAG: type II secretion system GspH family protein [Actinobacteria bacterium]|nr:type II secretion system GspH family protein [Actinomycetota bacterium]
MNNNYRKNSKKQAGLTAIEIIAVILIMGILGVVAVSRMTSTKTYNISAEVETLKANLRYVQFRGLSDADKRLSSNATTWGISISNNSYTLQKTEEGVTTNPGLFAESSATHNLASGISIATSLGIPVTIIYDAWGIPSVSGTPITADATITITDGASSRTIKVTKNTGFIP